MAAALAAVAKRLVSAAVPPAAWQRRAGEDGDGDGDVSRLLALLRSDLFPDLAVLLSPVDLSRLALSCRAGDAATRHACVWWNSCAEHYRFGNIRRHRAEVARQACIQFPGAEKEVGLARAWRQVAAGLWWHSRTPEEDPVEEVLQWMGQHAGAARVCVPVGVQGIRREPTSASALVWQREYRVIESLLHSVTFMFPLLARTDDPPSLESSGQDSGRGRSRGRRGWIDRMLLVAHSELREEKLSESSSQPWAATQAGKGAEQVDVAPNLRPLALRGGMQVFEHLVPKITGLQVLLEEAYAEQFDPPGAAYFDGGRLLGNAKPIGATECAVILRFLGIRAMLFDMREPSPEGQTHDSLMELCRFWFLSEHSCRFPLYLQYGSSDQEAGGSLLVLGIYCSGARRQPSDVGAHCEMAGVEAAGEGVNETGARGRARRRQCESCARKVVRHAERSRRRAGHGEDRSLASECHAGVWENGTHEEWDTLLVLNPDAAPTSASKLPPPHMLRTPGTLVPRGKESVHSLAASALNWQMVQVVGCGMGDAPLDLTAEERSAWRDLSVGHFRMPALPNSWDPHTLFALAAHGGGRPTVPDPLET